MALRSRQPLEYQEQIWLIDWRDSVLGQEPRLQWLYHVPNGAAHPSRVVVAADGKKTYQSLTAVRLRRMGRKDGVSDLHLPVPMLHRNPERSYHGLWLELKRVDGKKPADDEVRWLADMLELGYAADCCYGWVAAARFLCWYLCRDDLAFALA